MKIAIMQPYLLPYIGYWQLIKSVDKFIIFDDIAYINKGYINRNKILVKGKPYSGQVGKETSENNRIKL